MKLICILSLVIFLNACEQKENSTESDREPNQTMLHEIKLNQESESVIVTLEGKDDLTLRIFQRDGELVATVIDLRMKSVGSGKQAQRWELIAKSNREVQMYTRKEPFLLDRSTKDYKPTGTEVTFDADGDGILDYKRTSTGIYKVTKIELDLFEKGKFDDDISTFNPVKVEEQYTNK